MTGAEHSSPGGQVSWLRGVFQLVAQILVSPILVAYTLVTLLADRDEALHGFSQALSLLPGLPGCYLRSAFYRWVLDDFHPTARISFGALLSKTGAHIGANVYVGPYCQLGLVTLKRDTLLGPNVQIPSGGQTHGTTSLELPIREQAGEQVRITIGIDSWIGGQSVILADVGSQTIVGAGSVVTHELPTRVIAVGNPAKVLRSRDVDCADTDTERFDPIATIPVSSESRG